MNHAEASALAHASACLLCCRVGSCVPAHFPRHRGSGGRFGGDDWNPLYWVPLCGELDSCHDFADARCGGTRPGTERARQQIRELLTERATREWWPRFTT